MREEQKEAIQARADVYRNAAALFPALRKTIEAFDGKIYNCRLEKALRESTGAHIIAEKRYKWLEISVYMRGFPNQIMLAQIELEQLIDGKRIPAALLIESAREKRTARLQQAAALERSIETADQAREQMLQLAEMIKQIRESIPYETRDILRMDPRITGFSGCYL